MNKVVRALMCGVVAIFLLGGVGIFADNVQSEDKPLTSVNLSGLEASYAYLGTNYSYINNGYEVDSGCKPVSYMIFVENHTSYDIDDITAQFITKYPNTVSEAFDSFTGGSYSLLPGGGGNSEIVTLQVPQDLTDDEIYKALADNKLQIKVRIDKYEQTQSVKWRRATKQEIRDYAMPNEDEE